MRNNRWRQEGITNDNRCNERYTDEEDTVVAYNANDDLNDNEQSGTTVASCGRDHDDSSNAAIYSSLDVMDDMDANDDYECRRNTDPMRTASNKRHQRLLVVTTSCGKLPDQAASTLCSAPLRSSKPTATANAAATAADVVVVAAPAATSSLERRQAGTLNGRSRGNGARLVNKQQYHEKTLTPRQDLLHKRYCSVDRRQDSGLMDIEDRTLYENMNASSSRQSSAAGRACEDVKPLALQTPFNSRSVSSGNTNRECAAEQITPTHSPSASMIMMRGRHDASRDPSRTTMHPPHDRAWHRQPVRISATAGDHHECQQKRTKTTLQHNGRINHRILPKKKADTHYENVDRHFLDARLIDMAFENEFQDKTKRRQSSSYIFKARHHTVRRYHDSSVQANMKPPKPGCRDQAVMTEPCMFQIPATSVSTSKRLSKIHRSQSMSDTRLIAETNQPDLGPQPSLSSLVFKDHSQKKVQTKYCQRSLFICDLTEMLAVGNGVRPKYTAK